MYGVIYSWFASLFAGAGVAQLESTAFQVGGVSMDAVEWLSHTATILTLAVLVFVAFKFVWWLVRLVANGFTFKN